MIFKTDKTDVRGFKLHLEIVKGWILVKIHLIFHQAQHKPSIYLSSYIRLSFATFQLKGPVALFSSFILSPNSWCYNKKEEDWGNNKSLVVQLLLLFFLKLMYLMPNRLIVLTVYTIRSSKCDCNIYLEKYGRLINHIWQAACKVEFNQLFCWLYSVPNLLVF